ncbi:MAG: methionine--tRNA ligase [Anaerolineales bacterium]|nr:methionine--tRNA ligase [Anaerolineales bacterium]
MSRNILVAVAWPYANAEIHVGNITGAYLPADIFARYQRLRGNRVLMVSGSDAHGTPIMVRADAEGKSAQQVYEYHHQRFLDLFQKIGLTYDLFTTTHSENHFMVAQSIFNRLLDNGYLYRETEEQWYSPQENRFLPDRYVEGTCYLCAYENARGDQCDGCGSILDAMQLIEPHSKTGNLSLELRETEHYYLDLAKLSPQLSEYLATDKEHWRPNVIKPSRYTVEETGLHGRAITRDLDWGIPVPREGWEGKCLYVWFEAVIGYLSASIEWSKHRGKPALWQDWWYDPEARSYYFVGKDNIPFHAVIWPAELAGVGRLFTDDSGDVLNLPFDVPANEFMNLEGEKISGSRNWAVWGLDVVERYGPDPVRFYLTINMPESKDSDWTWSEFQQRNNDELVATWGNLANRILSFSYKHFEERVPAPGKLLAEDRQLLDTIADGFNSVGDLLSTVKLRPALYEALRLAGEVNKYLDKQAPWFSIKSDRMAAARSVYTALRAVDSLKIIFSPFVPFSSEQLHTYLGYDGKLFGQLSIEKFQESERHHTALVYSDEEATGRWQPSQLEAGQALRAPAPLFRKLDETIVTEEMHRLG